ncbi:hypothetical protein [Mailhella massiliensis]|uniref:hypothetical protein n=1 Tax=Mailhella massiliensis TaxID=1903261 RepID=UPI00097D82B5|nr:hypothetical protein [Mailhella massiliensis]
MDVERLAVHENVTAMTYAVSTLRKAAAHTDDDFDKAMLNRGADICLFLLEDISKEVKAGYASK